MAGEKHHAHEKVDSHCVFEVGSTNMLREVAMRMFASSAERRKVLT